MNGPSRDDFSLGEIVEAQAARTPGAPAVVFRSEALGYDALNRRANRLARYLQSLGVGPGAMVATMLDRPSDTIVAWLAIVKLGAAYVPLDPEHPRDRLKFLLDDSGASAVVTCSRLRTSAPSIAVTVTLDEEGERIAAYPDGNLPCVASGGSLAHLIYTSGSTGQPKGVGLPHRAVIRLVRDCDWFRFEASDRMAHAANVAFDAASLEVWGALMNGACVVCVPRETVLSPLAFAQFLRDQQISVTFLTTALFNMVVDANPAAFAGLRALLTGGEAMSARHARAVLASGAPPHFMNVYGPTENGVLTTYHEVRELAADATSVPIGRAVDHSDVVVLDADLCAVAAGEPGELGTGGVGLADGYWGRPDLTAARFVPHPCASTPGARLYLTGDRVRQAADGSIEFIGRVDQQVKVRGHRIEPGEIEAALLQHPAVAAAAVVTREDRPGDKRLVAYARAATVNRPSASDLRGFVADRLPAYMVPSAFVVLDEFALTPSGKIDRRALPAPPARLAREDYVAPRTPTEEVLAELWATTTGVAEAGITDDFFELGGHSLLAAQVVARINERLETALPISAIFERPTIADMAEHLAQMEPRLASDAVPLTKAPRGGPLPLSFSQEQVWFLNELEPGNLAYNFQANLRFVGALDVPALKRTLEEIVRRHEILRTAFVVVDDQPSQVIVDPMPIDLPVIDLRSLSEEARRLEMERIFREQFAMPFDLAQPPLVRWTLMRAADDTYDLVHIEHHIVHDGWSFSVLLREFKALYQAFSSGEPSPLVEPAWQFVDYSEWQRQALAGDALDPHIAFWRRYLAGAPALLELPTDHPRPEVHSFRGGCERVDVPTSLYAAMRAFSRQEKVTLFMTMTAAFQALLWRYTGEEDLVIGTAMANRPRREFEPVVGMFVNPTLLRTSVASNPTFRELVQRVRASALEMYAHQDTPFGKLVEALQPERHPGRNPLFQVLFSFHDAAVPLLTFDNVTGTIIERQNGSAKFDLNIICIPRVEQRAGDGPVSEEAGLTVLWEYSADLFERATARRLYDEFENVLRAATADPDLRLADLPFQSATERRKLLVEWNEPAAETPRAATLHSLFEAQARRRPEAIAVDAAGTHVSYGELNRRADLLARRLRVAGAGAEVLVGVVTRPSIALVVAHLAALKAGAVCVPIDADSSTESIRRIAVDRGLTVLVDDGVLDGVTLPGTVHRVSVDDGGMPATGGELPATAPVAAAVPDDLAYVLLGSSPTSEPAVMTTHGSVSRLFDAARASCTFDESDVWMLLHPGSADVSLWELWGALVHGGRLVVVPETVRRSAPDLYRLVCRERVTVLHHAPTAFGQFAAAQADSPAEHHLRHVILGGEALDVATLERWLDDGRNARASVVSTHSHAESGAVACQQIDRSDLGRSNASPIGRRLSDLRVYLLDAGGQPVPIGAPGRLFVGGAGLARGYLQRPDLSAERFVPDPFATEPGSRMFRTDDVCRWRSDGGLDLLGAAGKDVMIAGFRVYPAEIAALVARQAGVRQAAVVARADEHGSTQLVAYYTEQPGSITAPDALRGDLARKQPGHMVPAAYVSMDALPITNRGTLDREALPPPPAIGAEPAYIAPRTALEAQIAEIWRQVLGVERVGARDFFFDLGGHSLKTIQIRSRLSKELGVDLPLRAAFEHPTVEQQAQLLASKQPETPQQRPDAIPRVRETSDAPLSSAQRRLWFLHRLDPADTFYNRPIRVEFRGRLDTAALQRALDAIVQRHETLRTQYGITEDSEPTQTIVEQLHVPIATQDLSGSREPDRDLRTGLRSFEATPFTLETPPIRACLYRLADDRHVFVLVLHHIAVDGWSMDVLLSDLAHFYTAESEGVEPTLAPPAVRYIDYAAWHRRQSDDRALDGSAEYWSKQLSGTLPRFEFPSGALDDAGASKATHVEVVGCAAAAVTGLEAFARDRGATTFMLRLAVLQAFLARYTGQTDVMVGAPAAGRLRSELERVVGFFANTLALRTDLAGDPTFAEVLDRVRATAVDAYVHEAYPFDKVVERINPVRDADRLPLLQVLFGIEPKQFSCEVPGAMLSTMPDLTLEMASGGGAADRQGKLDLAVSCLEKPGGDVAWVFLVDGRRVSKSSAARLAKAFGSFLDALVERPDSRLSALPLLSDQEDQLLVKDRNATADEWQGRCVHELIEEQARLTPDAVAVAWLGERLTYAGLDRRANALAHRLRTLGVDTESRVGLYLDRTPDLLIAMLATLKAGAAYVPLDTKYPRARLEWMLGDAAASVVLTTPGLRQQLPSSPGVRVAEIDAMWRDASAQAEQPPDVAVSARHLAYIIYTSGSTGTPKGVAIEHRSASAFIHHARSMFSPADLAGSVASSSICFDFSVLEILVPLASGGTVILVESALHIPSMTTSVPPTMMCAVPSALAELVRDHELPPSIRVVNFGGEVLTSALSRAVYAQRGVERAVNVYGPTETTTFSTFAELQRDDAAEPALGRAIDNTRVYLLDAELAPVPVGTVGEIFIGGAGLARGYYGRPALTADRFIPNPFVNGGRLYRTGDRARSRTDGTLEFVGRRDHQVKLRGYRIELGEVEAALLTSGALREAVAVVREDAPGDQRLVAYVVPEAAGRASGEIEIDRAALSKELQRSLHASLPAYMVPSAVVVLDRLPRHPNGKVHRAALPPPPSAEVPVAPASTDLKSEIAAMWGSVLGSGPVGLDENVYELGAHSLMAVKVHRRIQDLLASRWSSVGAGVPPALRARIQAEVRASVLQQVPLRLVFDHPTVRTLVASLPSGDESPDDPSGPDGPGSGRVPTTGTLPDATSPVPASAGPFPASHAQCRIWSLHTLDPTLSAYNVVFPIDVSGRLDLSALRRALHHVVSRHAALRTTISLASDGALWQRIADDVDVPFAVHDLSVLTVAERSASVRDHLVRAVGDPFNLDTGPLLRCEVLLLGENEQRCHLCMHHLVVDGRSWELIFDQLVEAYGAFAEGGTPGEQPAAMRYADYAAWHHQRIENGELRGAEAYWLSRFENGIPALALPVDHQTPATRSFQRHRRVVVLDRETAAGLRAIAQDAGATPFIVYLAVLVAFLRRVTGQDDIVVGTPVSGRDHPDVDATVGCFINTVLMRTALAGEPTFSDLLAAVRSEALEAYTHQEYPLDLLARRLAVSRDAERSSLVQVLFAMAEPQPSRATAGVRFAVPTAGSVIDPQSEVSLPMTFDFHAGAMDEPDGGLTWVLGFSRDLFEASTADRLARRFELLVTALVRQPGVALSTLDFLTTEERDQLRPQRASGHTEYPTSFNQEEMWVQCQLQEASGLNNIGVEVALRGPLDVAAFQDALQTVVDRHEALRTAFDGSPDALAQRVAPVSAHAVVTDITHLDAAARIEFVAARREALVRASFDLAKAPLLRSELLRLDDRHTVFIFVVHHLVLDAFHLPLFLDEVARTYGRAMAGDRQPPPPLALQYGDFATGERRALAAGLLAHHKGYWQAQLRLPLPAMALPADRLVSGGRTFESGCVVRRLPSDVAVALKRLERRYRTTLYRTIVTAFQAWLWRMTGETDLLLAMPFSTRPNEYRDVLGFFGNTLPLRSELDVAQPFSRALAEVSTQLREGRDHREFPLTEAMRTLDVSRDLNRPALPICVSQIRQFATTAGDLELRADFPITRSSPFDLWLAVAEGHDGVEMELIYATEVFTADTVESWGDAIVELLRAIASNPETPIRDLPLVAAHHEEALQRWGDGGASVPFGSTSLAGQLAAVAATRANAVAVVASDHTLTHGELHDAATRVARQLSALRVGRETRVGIIGQRSAGMLTSVLGVVQVGAAFVPLEASQPDARLQTIALAAGVSVVLSDRASFARAKAIVAGVTPPIRVICWQEPAEAPAPATPIPLPAVGPRDLAYIFYTSGSTGAPKGVMVEQHGLLNHLGAKIATLDLDETSVVAQTASYGFDIVVWQWLAPLLAGGRVVIYDDEIAHDPAALLLSLARDGVSVVETVPSFLDAMLAVEPAAPLPALRWMVSNAEALPPATAARWQATFPAVRLLNTYGATECSDDTTHGEVAPVGDGVRVSVGRPIPGSTAAVVDESLRLLPPGCAGEVVLGGVAVGRGYVGDPVATATAFVPDPFSGVAGSRAYRTGDRGRWRADGELECLGRVDDQIKLHGYRVELAEVDAALAALPGVSQTAAAVRIDENGQRRLVAYYVAPEAVDVASCRSVLAARLPPYMMPSAFMRLARLPLTRTGKLDRAALPAPPRVESTVPSEAASSPIEAIIASVWQQVLRVPVVGRHDNFFDLGGDSIQSILVASHLTQQGLRVAPRAVFVHQTIAELAKIVDAAGPRPAPARAVNGPSRLLPIQSSFFERALDVPQHWNQAAWLSPPNIDEPALRMALQAVVDAHPSLRMRFVVSDGQRCQVPAPEGDAVAFEVLDVDESVEPLDAVAARLQRTLDLERGPVFRAALLRQRDGQGRLLIVAHHLVIDTVSWGILIEDLSLACAQASRGEAIALTPEACSYGEWVEATLAEGDRFDAELPYWQAVVDGSRPLPRDQELGANTEASADHVRVRIPVETTRRLLTGTRRALQAGVLDVLLCAFSRAAGSWTGEKNLTIYMEGHGREELSRHANLGRTIGWFTSAFPVSLETRALDRIAHVSRTKDSLQRVPSWGMGYSFLRWHRGRLSGTASADISFNYHGQADRVIPSGGLSVIRESVGLSSSPSNLRPVLVNIECRVVDGCLEVDCIYSRNVHRRDTIVGLTDAFVAELDHFAALCDAAALPAGIDDAYPLAPIQEGMLFHALFEPDSSLYFEQAHIALEGPLDIEALRSAWSTVLATHAVLRSVVRWEGLPAPAQFVCTAAPAPLRVVDLQQLSADEQHAHLEQDAREQWSEPFDLERGPLVRLALFVLGRERARLVWSFHHIILDGWSVTHVLRDLALAYQAAIERTNVVVQAPRPYRDFVEWLQSKSLDEALGFWRRHLSGVDQTTPLPRDRAVPSARRRESDDVAVTVDADVSRALGRWTRVERVTTSSLLRTAWAILLARLSGTEDVVFGATVSGRPADLGGVEHMVGPFINAVPVRVTLDPNETIAHLVKRVHGESVEAGAFEHVPLPEIQKACGLPADRPLFESLFVYENYPLEGRPAAMGGLRVRALEARELTHYDLTLMADTHETLRLRLAYATDVFDRATVQRIVNTLPKVLAAIAADPNAQVGDLSFMSADDAKQLAAWGDGGPCATAFDRNVAADVYDVAARTPHQIAVVSRDEQWTYSELSVAARRAAGALRANGVGRGSSVGVIGTRGPKMIATVLGALHAGAGFVPIEINQPDARIRSTVERSGLTVLVADRALRGRLDRILSSAAAPPVVLSWDDIAVEGEAIATPPVDVGPADLAYVLFTSGSTGEPKGVMVEQRGMRNHIRAKTSLLDLDAAGVLVQNASCSFDIIVWQMLAPLLVGGRVVVYDTATAVDGPALLGALAQDAVTIVELVPSVLKDLLLAAGTGTEAGAPTLPDLKWMVSNAEPLPAAVAARWHARFPTIPLLNCYGLTEASDDVTHVEITREHASTGRVPIGRPIPGSMVTVVDDRLALASPGCVGEIVVGGVAVARGYLGDPVATALAFVPDPFAETPGARLYRAGDRARWRVDGLLECLGRRDDQVKVHGHRVELGDVESALATVPELSQAAVAVRTDTAGQARLVAYYVAPRPCDVANVRATLAARLPAYMVPEVFLQIAALPQTVTGKLDRGALPMPPSFDVVPDAAERLLTPLESKVAAVWQSVLQAPRVRLRDTFFDLGGHSLTAIRIVAALKQSLGFHVPIWQLFQTPVFEEFVEAIRVAPPEVAPPIEPVGVRPWYPISSAQRAQWMVQQLSTGPKSHPPRILQLDGDLVPDALVGALHDLVERHGVLRTTFEQRDGDVVQIEHPGAKAAVVVDDLSELAPAARASKIRDTLKADTRRGFDLSRLPLFEARIVRVEPTRHLLVLRLPHIISDGWTEGVLVAELGELYSARCAARAPAIERSQLRYVDVAAREQEWLASSALQSQKSYWLKRFSSEIPVLRLPASSAGAEGREVAYATTLIDSGTIAAVRETAATRSATLFVALLTAFKILLSRLSGQSDVVVGTTVAGRSRPELEHVAGVFANLLALRTSVGGNPSVGEVLARVGKSTLEAMARQDYPFQLWISELRRARAQQDLRLFSAFFIMHEEAFSPAFEGLKVTWFGTDAFGNTLDPRALQWDDRQQIALAVNDAGEGWRVTMLGNPATFSNASLEGLLAIYADIVSQMGRDLSTPLQSVEVPKPASVAGATVALDVDELDRLFA
jgi:amino acid adenylation domain-containing protein/non-ribosomal peptide synthase protein (TIGR01720 family)